MKNWPSASERGKNGEMCAPSGNAYKHAMHKGARDNRQKPTDLLDWRSTRRAGAAARVRDFATNDNLHATCEKPQATRYGEDVTKFAGGRRTKYGKICGRVTFLGRDGTNPCLVRVCAGGECLSQLSLSKTSKILPERPGASAAATAAWSSAMGNFAAICDVSTP